MIIDSNFWHFLPYRYIWSLLSSRKLHFRNVAAYSESDVVRVDDKSFFAESIGYFSFTDDPDAVCDRYFWKKYAQDGFGAAVGFRSSGFRRDGGPVASADKAIAIKTADRPIKNLYLTLKEEGQVQACYYAMVFYEKHGGRHEGKLTALSSDDLTEFEDLCFTCKPSEDSPDHEERLIILDCPESRDIDYSRMYPHLYPNQIALGFDLPIHYQQAVLDMYGSRYPICQTKMDWRTERILVVSTRSGNWQRHSAAI